MNYLRNVKGIAIKNEAKKSYSYFQLTDDVLSSSRV